MPKARENARQVFVHSGPEPLHRRDKSDGQQSQVMGSSDRSMRQPLAGGCRVSQTPNGGKRRRIPERCGRNLDVITDQQRSEEIFEIAV